ncbi:hypothetical protein BpHYR1_028483 [Brachionus plicatilis]|uniref:Uncharacterized protein n=1 Tax=Brachionus plicatilis TaxID=10195 RepID=A0A3M7R9P8_BRAPC|nr:hypothetical protein BpHYR1_028483 [Brachionus plicatilis]
MACILLQNADRVKESTRKYLIFFPVESSRLKNKLSRVDSGQNMPNTSQENNLELTWKIFS